jgi:predicted RNase H-like nuclease (RuvC/YqgF family)
MTTSIIIAISIASICYAIYLKQELSTSKTIADNLTNDNRFKATAIERYLKEKMELQANYAKESVDLMNRVNDVEQANQAMLNDYNGTVQMLEKDIDDLRAIITRKDETISRYKAEIDKLNNPRKKKPYHFDESKAPKSKSKASIEAAKKLRNEKCQFSK